MDNFLAYNTNLIIKQNNLREIRQNRKVGAAKNFNADRTALGLGSILIIDSVFVDLDFDQLL